MEKNNQKIKQLLVIGLIVLIATGMGVAIGAVTWVVQQSPDIENYGQWQTNETTVVYDRDGEKLTELYEENRVYTPLEEIPDNLQNAVIAIEDSRFENHYGIDPQGIMRAIWVDITELARVQGGSTITQQLAKNALLTHEKLFSRKLQEMYIALQFERMYTKSEILEFYLNEIFLGHSSYGVQSAANFYFNKDVQELTLSESALIAGMIRAPNYYSPYRRKEEAEHRRNVVLNRMEELDYITPAEAEAARQEEIDIERPDDDEEDLAPYFVRHVREKLLDKFGAKRVYTGGLEVHTSLDSDIQRKAKNTMNQALEDETIPTVDRAPGRGDKQPQYALTSIDPNSGHIKAMIGGRGEDKFNRATQAHRQPGSAFKPFVYASALKQGIGPGSVIDDTPKVYQTTSESDEEIWLPTNYNDEYLGPTTLRTGLARSINVMAVKLADKVGLNNVMQTANQLGIQSLSREDQNLAAMGLGGLSRGVTPLQMTKAYVPFANNGVRVEPIAITEVYDNYGNLIWNNEAEKRSERDIVLEEPEAYLMTDMLESVLSRGPDLWGTGWRANLGRPAAGKTGTTSQYTDAWFVGYTPELVSSVWLGEDQPTPMEYPEEKAGEDLEEETEHDNTEEEEMQTISSGTAATLWNNYMQQVIEDRPVNRFERPEGIITKEVCSVSGKLPNEYCEEEGTIIEELFIEEAAPQEECDVHKETDEVEVNTENWTLATRYCPSDEVETKRYQVETDKIVDEQGVPVREFEEVEGYEVEVPVQDEEGNYVYKKVPTEECEEHEPDDEDDIQDRIMDFFDTLRN